MKITSDPYILMVYDAFIRYREPLKKAHTKQCISHDRLSKIADFSLNTIVTLETGPNAPTIETLMKVAKVLNVDINDLIK